MLCSEPYSLHSQDELPLFLALLEVPLQVQDTATLALVALNFHLQGAQGEVCKGEVRCVLPSRGLP